MAHYSYILRDVNSKKDTPIILNINYSVNKVKKRVKFYINESIHPKEWQTEKGKSNYQRAKNTRSNPDNYELNVKLDTFLAKAKKVFRAYENENSQKPPTPEKLKELLQIALLGKTTTNRDFFQFFTQFIEESKTKINPKTGRPTSKNTIKNYQTAYKHLKTYSIKKKKAVDFDTINYDFYKDFTHYLNVSHSFKVNTIGSIIKVLKTVLNEATERGINTNMAFKSKKFVVLTAKTDSISLSEKELLELNNLDLSANPKLERVRDLFLVGCQTGLRFSDLSKLTLNNIKGDFIELRTQKTGDDISIPIHDMVKTILRKYNFKLPRAISNQKTNNYLKEICSKVSLLNEEIKVTEVVGGKELTTIYKKYDLVTTHTGRRSFATNLYLRNTPVHIIMGVTGHKTEASFFKYIKISKKDEAKILKMYMDNYKIMKAV